MMVKRLTITEIPELLEGFYWKPEYLALLFNRADGIVRQQVVTASAPYRGNIVPAGDGAALLILHKPGAELRIGPMPEHMIPPGIVALNDEELLVELDNRRDGAAN